MNVINQYLCGVLGVMAGPLKGRLLSPEDRRLCVTRPLSGGLCECVWGELGGMHACACTDCLLADACEYVCVFTCDPKIGSFL